MEKNKERAVYTGEIVALDEAFTMYTKGVVFSSEEKRVEALNEYVRGYIYFPEEEGDVPEYVEKNIPYFEPGAVVSGEGIPTLKRAYNLATKALKELSGVYDVTEEAANLAGLPNLEERLKPISAANFCIELVRENIYGRLKKEGGEL